MAPKGGALVVVGAQWGDEGKGKVIDYLAQHADLVVRFQGGPNAGHTVEYSGKSLIFHQAPTGLTNPDAKCLIGAGCVVDLPALKEELEPVVAAGLDYAGRLFIDRKAHLVLPYHRILDQLREQERGQRKIGTTSRGIGPCYEDKFARIGIRFCDLLHEGTFSDRLRRNLALKNFLLMELHKAEPLSARQIRREFSALAHEFGPMATDGSRLVARVLERKGNVLFEGAQGALLDIDHGTYPYVTSSSCASGASSGVGIGAGAVANVLGVAKAYTTRVGKGPFPTEASGKLARHLRRRGNEYGATTGRPRRCGWFDAPLVRYAARVGGIKRLALTKFDILDDLATIRVCMGYDSPEGYVHEFDPTVAQLRPRYVDLPGWCQPTTNIRRFEDLPKNARHYLARIEREIGIEVVLLSVGRGRDATIVRGRTRWF
ncbi:MAG: adenylosuccinate synthase [candidate division WOR-3 bacterium]